MRENTRTARADIDPYKTAKVYEDACEWLRSEEGKKFNGEPNYHGALERFPNLKYPVLYSRYNKLHQPAVYAHTKQQMLNVVQERTMVEWAVKDAREAQPWDRSKLKLRVKELTGKEPSDKWARGFDHRHEDELKFRKTAGLDPKRAQCFNPTTIKEHFKIYGEIEGNYRLKFNPDETGHQRGGGRKNSGKKHYTIPGRATPYKHRDGNLELSTIIECCCSDGTMLDPSFLFSNKEGWTTAYFEGFEDRQMSVGLTSSGWTNVDQFYYWFEHTFIPQVDAKRINKDERVLVIFDGHNSHLQLKVMDLGTKHNIDFYLLSAHCTHKCQPLDVGCFGPMSTDYIRRCEERVEHTGLSISADEFVRAYMMARQEAIQEANVKASWRKTGLAPFNPDVFTEADFAPSRPWSTQAYFPSTFPVAPPVVANNEEESTAVHTDIATPLTSTPPSIAVGQSEPVASAAAVTEASLTDINTEENATQDDWNLGAKIPEYTRTHVGRYASLAQRLEAALQDRDRLEELYMKEFERRQELEVHCINARADLNKLKNMINERDKRKARRKQRFSSQAVFLSGPEAQRIWEEEREAIAVQEAAKAAKEAAQKDQQIAQQQRRTDLAAGAIDVQYSGSLKSKNKTVLSEIGFLLGLIFEKKTTKEQMQEAIKKRLMEQASLRQDRRFIGLYTASNGDNLVLQTADVAEAPVIPDEDNSDSDSDGSEDEDNASGFHANHLLSAQVPWDTRYDPTYQCTPGPSRIPQQHPHTTQPLSVHSYSMPYGPFPHFSPPVIPGEPPPFTHHPEPQQPPAPVVPYQQPGYWSRHSTGSQSDLGHAQFPPFS